MNPLYLIPYTEPIPAPAEIFIILEQLFFLIHIIIINSIFGLSLIILYQWNKKQDSFIINKPHIIQKYTGGDLFAKAMFTLSIITAFFSIFMALKADLKGSLLLVFLTLVFMVINRYNLRVFHLDENFNISQLRLSPQWDVFATFLVILLLGLAIIFYMLKINFSKQKRLRNELSCMGTLLL